MNTTLNICLHLYIAAGIFLTGKFYSEEDVSDLKWHAQYWLVPIVCIVMLPINQSAVGYTNLWNWLNELFQIKFYYKFYFKKWGYNLSIKDLDERNTVSNAYKNTSSLRHRIWRHGMKLINKRNNYQPQKPQTDAK